MNAELIAVIISVSSYYGMDSNLSYSVAMNESGMNPNAIGSKGEIGLFQLLPSSFPGFTPKQLKEPVLNITLGIGHLAEMKKRCKHKKDFTFLSCYNAGVTGATRIKSPKTTEYYKRTLKIYERLQAGRPRGGSLSLSRY